MGSIQEKNICQKSCDTAPLNTVNFWSFFWLYLKKNSLYGLVKHSYKHFHMALAETTTVKPPVALLPTPGLARSPLLVAVDRMGTLLEAVVVVLALTGALVVPTKKPLMTL